MPGEKMFARTNRDHTHPPLAYPYKPMSGDIPIVVLDRLSFLAFECRKNGDPLGTFMIRAWEQIRYPHISMMHSLLDTGLVRRVSLSRDQESWEWVNCARKSTSRSEARKDAFSGAINGFFDVSKISEFSSTVGVTPWISPISGNRL